MRPSSVHCGRYQNQEILKAPSIFTKAGTKGFPSHVTKLKSISNIVHDMENCFEVNLPSRSPSFLSTIFTIVFAYAITMHVFCLSSASFAQEFSAAFLRLHVRWFHAH